MKKIIFLLIGIFVFALGCNNEILDTDSALETLDTDSALETVDLKLEAVDLEYSKTRMVPVKGEVIISVDEYDEQGLGINGKMAGHLTHMGKLNQEESTWVTLYHDFSQYPPLVIQVNDLVFCAANGDLLYGSYTGYMDVTTSVVDGLCILENGTGRFENATGQSNVTGYPWYDELGRVEGIRFICEGEISY